MAITTSGTELVREVIDNGEVRAQQLVIIAACLFFNMLDGFDITAMAVVASAVSAELRLTPDRLGWIFSFALAGMMTGAMFLAPVSDIIGRRKIIIISIILVGVSVILTARASTLTEFIVLRFVSGLGGGAMLASQAALAAEYSPDRYRALSVAAVTSGYPLGAMMTSVVAGVIVPDHGWRGMFWFGGAVTLCMVLVAWRFLPESLQFLFERRPAGSLRRVNAILERLKQDTLDEMPAITLERDDQAGFLQSIARLLAPEQRNTTLKIWSAFFLTFSTLYFLMSWIPNLMEDAGFGAEGGSQAFFLFNLGGCIGIFLMGWASTRQKLTNLICGMLLVSAAGMIVFALIPRQFEALLALTLLIGVLQQGGFTGMYAVSAKAYSTEIRSTGIGWGIGLGRTGAVVGPAVAGYLIAAGLSMSANYLIFAIPPAIAGIVAYRLNIR
jgi:AAHS family 4-hydroxybenzoate transporter-like MFS transporter